MVYNATDFNKNSILSINMGPGPRFEPESRDPQSRRITTYPTPAFEIG